MRDAKKIMIGRYIPTVSRPWSLFLILKEPFLEDYDYVFFGPLF